MCQTMCGWNISAAAAARRMATNSVRMAGIFLTISTPVITGTRKSQRFMLKQEARSPANSAIVLCEDVSCVRLTARNIMRAMTNEGIVVRSM